MGKYDDIINLPHPTSKNHPQMSVNNRAAQFAPFAALTGYAEAINNSKISNDDKVLLSEDKKEELEVIFHQIHAGDRVELKYYSKNKYVTYVGLLKTIDATERKIVFDNRKSIPIKDVVDIKLLNNE